MAHRRRPLPRGLGDRILRVFLAVSLTVPQITIPFVAHAENEAKSTTRDYSKLDIPVSDEKWKTRLKFLEARYDEAVRNVHKLLDSAVTEIVHTVRRTGGRVAGPIPIPTRIERYTVNRSTHVNKKSREQFEIRVHKRLMERAESLEIPLKKKDLKVSRNASEITITAKYSQEIDLKVTKYTFSFDHRQQAPLF